MQDVSLHTFEGGMNKDLAKSRLQANQYTDARNVTISFNESNNMAALTNADGNKIEFTLPDLYLPNIETLQIVETGDETRTTQPDILFSDLEISSTDVAASAPSYSTHTDYRIVGYTTVRDTLIMLVRAKSSTNGLSMIYTKDLTNSDYPVLKYIGILNFPMSPIDVVGNYESSTIQKVYWADGVNELGHFNFADPDGYKLNADKLSRLGNMSLTNIQLVSESDSGEFDSGKVQYAYQYYNISGTKSALSIPTALLDIAEESFRGTEDTGKVFKSFTLSFIGDTSWDRVKIYRIQYTTSTNTAQIYIVKDTEVLSNITFTDTGSTELPTESIEILQSTLLTSIVPSNIKSKDNRLLIGNYKESIYNPNYDTRAYRFPQSSIEALVDDEGGDNYTIDSTNSFQITKKNGIAEGPYAVPEDADVINLDIKINSIDITTKQMYKANSSGVSGLGASGVNVTVGFTTESISIDTDNTNIQSLVSNGSDNVGTSNNYNKISWKRDEIYRVGCRLINTAGLKSSPRWILDLRMPSAVEYPIITESSGEVLANYIYPTFQFDNLPNDCVGVEIVRVERTDANKTCISQGVIMPTVKDWVQDTYHPVVSNTVNLFSTDLLGFDFYELDKTTNSQQAGVVVGDIIFVNESYETFVGEQYIGYWKCTSAPGATNIGVGSVIGAPENIEDYCIRVFRADSPTGAADANMVSYQLGQVFSDSFSDAEKALNGKHMHQYGYLDKSIINFFCPEISINKSINVGTANYFKVSHYELMDGKHYSQGIISTGLTEIGNSALPKDGSPSVDGEDYGVDQVFIYAKGQSAQAPTTIPQVTFDIEKSQVLVPDAVTNLQGTGNFEISNTYIKDFDGRCGTSLFAEIEEVTLDIVDGAVIVVDYRAPFVSQYGGLSQSARLDNEYISASDFQSKIGTTAVVTAKQGDTYISQWNTLPNYYRAGSLCRTYSSLNYLESDINLNKPLDTTVATYPENGIVKKNEFITNTWREFRSDGTNRNYDINPVYSLENKFITSFSISNITNNNVEYETYFKVSELKFIGETSDSWLDFKVNNFIAVDGKYGPINAIAEINDQIIYFQDDAIGVLSINPKAVASTSAGNLIIGTGGILDDFKYISTTHGCKNKESIVKTPKGLYYFDSKANKIRVLGDEQSPYSDIQGLNQYLKDNVDTGINTVQANGVTAGYDYINNKIYFTFQGNNVFTIAIDETFGKVESFIDCHPMMWMTTRQGLYSTRNVEIYNNNVPDRGYSIATGNKGSYFGSIFPSHIQILFNKTPQILKVPNNIEFFLESFDSSGDELIDNTFDFIKVWNNYQDTTKLPLDQTNDRIHIFNRKWRTFIPRNYKPYNPTILTLTNNNLSIGEYVLHPVTFYLYKVIDTVVAYNLPGNNSLDPLLFSKEVNRLDRIKDFFAYIELEFTNQSDQSFVLHDLMVKYDF